LAWRDALARVRRLIREADPHVVEEVKWKKPSNAMRGVPVWEHAGIICTGETYKSVVKLTFAKGAALKDSSRLFNASLEGGTRRAIDNLRDRSPRTVFFYPEAQSHKSAIAEEAVPFPSDCPRSRDFVLCFRSASCRTALCV
jgi:hypothetical protein